MGEFGIATPNCGRNYGSADPAMGRLVDPLLHDGDESNMYVERVLMGMCSIDMQGCGVSLRGVPWALCVAGQNVLLAPQAETQRTGWTRR